MITPWLPENLNEMMTVQEDSQRNLLDMDNVVGVGLGHKVKGDEATTDPCISVLVTHKVDKTMLNKNNRVPGSIQKVKTDVVAVGELFAGGGSSALLDDEEDEETPSIQLGVGPGLRTRLRPAQGGFSVGNSRRNSAGTLGTCCYDSADFPGRPSTYYILSNNHVLALSNDGRPGDAIVQPGRLDGGRTRRDTIARLSRFVPIRFHDGSDRPCNLVDAALAEGDLQDLDREVYWIGHARGKAPAAIDQLVQKSGRTTGYTTGRVRQINATVDVSYGEKGLARFCGQIITTAMSAPGDSGSLVLDLEENAVGLLFAGSERSTILNPIDRVEAMLGVQITET